MVRNHQTHFLTKTYKCIMNSIMTSRATIESVSTVDVEVCCVLTQPFFHFLSTHSLLTMSTWRTISSQGVQTTKQQKWKQYLKKLITEIIVHKRSVTKRFSIVSSFYRLAFNTYVNDHTFVTSSITDCYQKWYMYLIKLIVALLLDIQTNKR